MKTTDMKSPDVKKCEFCDRNVEMDKYRCEQCHTAYLAGFSAGEESVKQEVTCFLKKFS